MSSIFDDINDLGLDDLGRINDEGLVDVESPADNPVLFEDQFEMRSRELQASPPRMQTVDIFPTKAGPWSGNNNLGIEQPFAPDINNQQTILKLPEWGFPEVWTLCLGINDFTFTVPPADTINFDVKAVIQFGTGGVIQEVEIDWLNGTCISLPMNALNVIAKYTVATAAEVGFQAPPDLRLRASIVRGHLPTASPTLTLVTRATDVVLPVPKFAKSVFIATHLDLIPIPPVTPFDFYASGAWIKFAPAMDPAFFTDDVAVCAVSQFVSYLDFVNSTCGGPQWIPIPPFTRGIAITNPGGAIVPWPASTYIHFAISV